MSEITAEHVAEALALAQGGGYEDEQGAGHLMQARKWSQHVPDYVQRAWLDRGLGSYITALTRWHAEIVAAEPVRRVARWDAERGVYWLTPPHAFLHTNPIGVTGKREEAIAWGYTIEGGPEPLTSAAMRAICSECGGDGVVHSPDGRILGECLKHTPQPIDDTAPERLRERREALGKDEAWIEHILNGLDVGVGAYKGDSRNGKNRRMVAEGDPDGDDSAYDFDEMEEIRAAYAAALSAAEAERAAKPHMEPNFRKAIAAMRAGGASLGEVADVYSLGIAEVCEAIDAEAHDAEREASQLTHLIRDDVGIWPGFGEPKPAPEVVDVPQPVVKLSGDTEARWNGPGAILVRFTGPTYPGKASLTVPIPLLRAMLADIDAQQGGAS